MAVSSWFGLRTTDYGLRTLNAERRIPNYQLPTPNQFPTTNVLLRPFDGFDKLTAGRLRATDGTATKTPSFSPFDKELWKGRQKNTEIEPEIRMVSKPPT